MCVFLAIAHKCSGIAQDVYDNATEHLSDITEAEEFLKNSIEHCKELLECIRTQKAQQNW